MSLIKYINQSCRLSLFNKELLLGLFLILFILGIAIGFAYQSYNDFRVFQVLLILSLCIWNSVTKPVIIATSDAIFLIFITIGTLFWQHHYFIVVDLLLIYLLYKTFQILKYQNTVAKSIVLLSLSMFLLLPLSIWDYLNTGKYHPLWYHFSLNIRVYDSYFFIMSVFSVWFYINEKKYKFCYLLFVFLALLAVLLDGARSVTIAYTIFIIFVSIIYRSIRWRLTAVYMSSWLVYLLINYSVSSSKTSVLRVLRESSSGRLDLWTNAYYCWTQHPIIGCGFYQLDYYKNLSAHPHNFYIQILSETGLIGFSFLVFAISTIISRINWHYRSSYFAISALIAIGIDLAFSGVHVYPVTQIALLWLLIFLLKSPHFFHSQYFCYSEASEEYFKKYLSLTVYLIISIVYLFLFITTSALEDLTMSMPPRFWINGYSLF
ncbi:MULTISPECIES: O-antigen ligase family protein [unclassified Psychrobacter]|uniref:O-antigen ligase family protein n=1 Tax=unclassified Psychrobacter TaxID=196806 RepID=UPI0018F73728|nr:MULTISPECIES: O-antigen ligase family protein [unclassified Psychrobacter]